jgi:hypothetical protein
VKQLQHAAGVTVLSEASCEPLDGSAPSTATECEGAAAPIMASVFEPLNRGEPYKVTVPVQPIAAGARSMPPSEE